MHRQYAVNLATMQCNISVRLLKQHTRIQGRIRFLVKNRSSVGADIRDATSDEDTTLSNHTQNCMRGATGVVEILLQTEDILSCISSNCRVRVHTQVLGSRIRALCLSLDKESITPSNLAITFCVGNSPR